MRHEEIEEELNGQRLAEKPPVKEMATVSFECPVELIEWYQNVFGDDVEKALVAALNVGRKMNQPAVDKLPLGQSLPKTIQANGGDGASLPTTQGLGRVIYGIELEDLYIMAALSGYEPSTALNSDFIAERCIEVGLLAYKRRLELKRVST